MLLWNKVNRSVVSKKLSEHMTFVRIVAKSTESIIVPVNHAGTASLASPLLSEEIDTTIRALFTLISCMCAAQCNR